jgi:hypothetical protein
MRRFLEGFGVCRGVGTTPIEIRGVHAPFSRRIWGLPGCGNDPYRESGGSRCRFLDGFGVCRGAGTTPIENRGVWTAFSPTFLDLPRPSPTFPDLPLPSSTFPDLPRPSSTFPDLPDLPRPSPTFPDLGSRTEEGRRRSKKVGEGRRRSRKVEEGRGRSKKVGEGRRRSGRVGRLRGSMGRETTPIENRGVRTAFSRETSGFDRARNDPYRESGGSDRIFSKEFGVRWGAKRPLSRIGGFGPHLLERVRGSMGRETTPIRPPPGAQGLQGLRVLQGLHRGPVGSP